MSTKRRVLTGQAHATAALVARQRAAADASASSNAAANQANAAANASSAAIIKSRSRPNSRRGSLSATPMEADEEAKDGNGDDGKDDDYEIVEKPTARTRRAELQRIGTQIFAPLSNQLKSDHVIARKTLVITIVAMIGIVFMIASLQACWNLEAAECAPTDTMQILRAFISASTILLVYLLLDRKQCEINQKLAEAASSTSSGGSDGWGSSNVRNSLSLPIKKRALTQQDSPASTSPLSTPAVGNTRRKSTNGGNTSASSAVSSSPGEVMDNVTGSPRQEMKEPLLPPGAISIGYGGTGTSDDRGTIASVPLSDRKKSVDSDTAALDDVSDARAQRRIRGAGKNVQFSDREADANALPHELKIGICGVLNINPRRRIYWKVWIQILICAFHPFPYCESVASWYRVDDMSLLMLLRLHLLLRVLRDNSDVYQHRHTLIQTLRRDQKPSFTEFDWWLTFKTLCYRSPILFTTSMTALLALTYGYMVYIFERETQSELFDYWASAYLALQCLLTGYASDTFGVYNPVLIRTQLVCLLATVSGLFCTSFLIGVVAEKVLPSRFEKQTLYMLDRRRLIHKEQIAAVRLLQCAFREALRRRRLARDRITVRGGSLSTRQQSRDDDGDRSMFIVQFAQRRKEFAKSAQRRTELDDNMELNGILPPEPDQTQQQMVQLLQATQKSLQEVLQNGIRMRASTAAGANSVASKQGSINDSGNDNTPSIASVPFTLASD